MKMIARTFASLMLAVITLSQAQAGENAAATDREVSAGQSVTSEAVEQPGFMSRFRKVSLSLLNRSGERRPTAFGLKLDTDGGAAPDQLVVFIHGYNSNSKLSGALLEPVRRAGLPCATFDYPNDQAICDSARLLSTELKKLHEHHPKTRVAVLAHSMGGLVAREAVENSDLDPGNVCRLIMVAPPTHGSTWARFAFATDVWDHCIRHRESSVGEYLYRSLEDGFGEAEDDLTPESPFLTRLNARPRNPRVAYSIFLGTGGRLDEEELKAVRGRIRRAAGNNRVIRFVGYRVEQIVVDAHDTVILGDGVVSVERGRLAGVDDTVLLPFDHCNVLLAPAEPPVQQLHAAILERLGAPNLP